MERKWEKLGAGLFSFSIEDRLIGEMYISINTINQLASCKIEHEKYTINRVGFWKSNLKVLNKTGELVITVHRENWYSNNYVFNYHGEKFNLSVSNKQQKKLIISHSGESILSYSLNPKLKEVLITTSNNASNLPVIFDFILWYFFVTLSFETMDNDFTFQLLLTAQ
ncbi:MAG: hypothetical protein ACXITV_06265 [Luteibaculaceae bacterium]